jgi:hypothetical protein
VSPLPLLLPPLPLQLQPQPRDEDDDDVNDDVVDDDDDDDDDDDNVIKQALSRKGEYNNAVGSLLPSVQRRSVGRFCEDPKTLA